MAQVFTMDIQAEVLRLLLTIITTFPPSPGTHTRAAMTSLLQLPDDTIDTFERRLRETGSEKEQRALIRTLVAQAGNDEVKKVLSSVGKVQPAKAQPADKPQPVRRPGNEQDELLGGAIFNMIFGA
eukprot:364145-Chlamydomonas_euryale.AAC.3